VIDTRGTARKPDRIYGIDFSGAADAGSKIWIATAVIVGDRLQIEACYRASDLPGSATSRDQCLAALRGFVERQKTSVFGFDFPFGLPEALVKQHTWEDFVLRFPEEYPSPEEFRCVCREAAGGTELKRVTDCKSQTPFSPYNLRLYRQTYFGICDLLHPLVRDATACPLPMQSVRPDRPWVLEVCPASTLKHEGLYQPYKGKTAERRVGRARILETLEEHSALSAPAQTVRSEIVEDRGGDALDSVIAALATFRALGAPALLAAGPDSPYALEGYVYV
jgi:hypothetical protein